MGNTESSFVDSRFDVYQHLGATDHQAKIVGNLLAIICGESKVQPTYAIQESESHNDEIFKQIHASLVQIQVNTKKPE
ncbi:MAG: hypothetical protein FJ267_05320 [Planctomycetes bacterium]|nr:hypothetical protein [Planctomycetota bacterium]